MKKFIVHSSWFMVKICMVVLLLLSTINYQLPTVFAVDSSLSASQSADFRAKLKTLQDEIASKAAQLKNEVSKKLQNRAYVGFIINSSPISISINTEIATKSATINEFTQITSKGKVVKSVVAGEFVAALGDTDEAGVLTAKKIIKLTPPKKVEEKTIYGKVLSKTSSQITIQDLAKQSHILTVDDDTIFKTARNGDSTLKNLVVGSPIIAIGTLTEKNIIQVRFIYGF